METVIPHHFFKVWWDTLGQWMFCCCCRPGRYKGKWDFLHACISFWWFLMLLSFSSQFLCNYSIAVECFVSFVMASGTIFWGIQDSSIAIKISVFLSLKTNHHLAVQCTFSAVYCIKYKDEQQLPPWNMTRTLKESWRTARKLQSLTIILDLMTRIACLNSAQLPHWPTRIAWQSYKTIAKMPASDVHNFCKVQAPFHQKELLFKKFFFIAHVPDYVIL